MTDVNCDTIDEALAAFGIGALEEEDAAGVRDHLAGCRRHDATLAELEAVASRLTLAPEEREPPARLRARLLARFDAEAGRRSEGKVVRPAIWSGLPRPALAIAALLLIAIGLATWNVVLQAGGDGDGAARFAFAGETGSGELLHLADEGLIVLDLDLPPSPAGRVYQVWGVHETQAVSLGFVRDNAPTALVADLEGALAVAISVEPEGGSEQPTTDPLLVAEFD